MLGQQMVNGVMLGSVYAMVAVGLTLSIGVLNFLNFSIPGIFMLGGMITWTLINVGLPWPAALLGALAVAFAASLLVELFTWRWMRGADHARLLGIGHARRPAALLGGRLAARRPRD
jgi:branched-chain amino acid transport system permease protein